MFEDNFKNEFIKGIHASRYIASWRNRYQGAHSNYLMKQWLRDLKINGEHLTEEEVTFIWNFATNGKMELEDDARRWLRKNWK